LEEESETVSGRRSLLDYTTTQARSEAKPSLLTWLRDGNKVSTCLEKQEAEI
jgi:hypothetical protein